MPLTPCCMETSSVHSATTGFYSSTGPYLLVLIAERFFLKGQWQEKTRAWAEHRYVVWFYVVSYFVWMVVRNILHI